MIYEVSGLAEAYKYVWGNGIDDALLRFGDGDIWYLDNQLGSVMALTNDAGQLIESYSYDVYGAVTAYVASGQQIPVTNYDNRYLFTGREYNWHTKLYHYRARTYHPVLGRFLSRDPVSYGSIYDYCHSAPINSIDPLGLRYWWRTKPICPTLCQRPPNWLTLAYLLLSGRRSFGPWKIELGPGLGKTRVMLARFFERPGGPSITIRAESRQQVWCHAVEGVWHLHLHRNTTTGRCVCWQVVSVRRVEMLYEVPCVWQETWWWRRRMGKDEFLFWLGVGKFAGGLTWQLLTKAFALNAPRFISGIFVLAGAGSLLVSLAFPGWEVGPPQTLVWAKEQPTWRLLLVQRGEWGREERYKVPCETAMNFLRSRNAMWDFVTEGPGDEPEWWRKGWRPRRWRFRRTVAAK